MNTRGLSGFWRSLKHVKMLSEMPGTGRVELASPVDRRAQAHPTAEPAARRPVFFKNSRRDVFSSLDSLMMRLPFFCTLTTVVLSINVKNDFSPIACCCQGARYPGYATPGNQNITGCVVFRHNGH